MSDTRNSLFGQVISRLTMAVLGAALIFGGIKCLHASARINANFFKSLASHDAGYNISHRNDYRPGTILFVTGLILVGLGAFFAFGAVVPASVLEKATDVFTTPP